MAYTKTNWQDLPNTTTPVNATNLNKIENELETLDTKTTDSGWQNATLENGWTSINGRAMRYRKIGKAVYVQGTITGGTYSGGTTLFTLPSGYRNTMDYQKFVGEYFSNGAQPGYVYVYTNGKVVLDVSLPGNNEFSISFSFLTD